MAGQLDYRSGQPELSSSSPLTNLHDLSSSDPISPGSPSPAYRRSTGANASLGTVRPNAFLSPNNSHPDPFSANAKASPNSHPSFGKDQLRAKHLRNSPQPAISGATATWALSDAKGRGVDQHSEVFGRFFDSSDDNPSSDEPSMFSVVRDASPSSLSSFQGSSGRRTGLGIQESGPLVLGEPFQMPTSPTLGKKSRARPFERTQSSTQDPFSATGGSARLPPLHARNQGSPRSQPAGQRRRLVGTSPKKLSRAAGSGKFEQLAHGSDSDESGCPWEQTVPAPGRANVDWSKEVERVFEEPKLNGKLILDDRGISTIHPTVADLAKHVNIGKPLSHKDDDTHSSGPFSRTSSFARSASLSNASDQLAGSAVSSPARTRSSHHLASSQGSDGLQFFLARNRLRFLSSAMFAVTNMTVLTIRNNDIKELPAAIGQLINLRELNVSNCGLRHLPAEMQQLNLKVFSFFPNPFVRPPPDARLMVRRLFGHAQPKDSEGLANERNVESTPPSSSAPGSMGPPAIPLRSRAHVRLAGRTSFAMAGVQRGVDVASGQDPGVKVIARVLGEQSSVDFPTLKELCIRRLLRPEGSSSSNGAAHTLLDQYEAGSLSRLRFGLSTSIVKSLEAGRRSASCVWGQLRPAAAKQESWCSGAGQAIGEKGRGHAMRKAQPSELVSDDIHMVDRDQLDEGEASAELSTDEELQSDRHARTVDVEQELDEGDDARNNPWFNRCPNPRHVEPPSGHISFEHEEVSDWPHSDPAQLFAHTSVQRIEWVSHVAGYKVADISVSPDLLNVGDSSKLPLAQNSNCLPLLWRGCGPNCLDFLEDA